MRRFVVFDPNTGKIDGCAEVAQSTAEDNLMIGEGMEKLDVQDFVDPDFSYVVSGAIVARPAPTIYPAEMTAPAVLAFQPGETVFARNEAGVIVTTDDPADPITITSPGEITVTVDGPFPSYRQRQNVQVT